MRYTRIVGLVLALTLLAVVLPARAEGNNPAVTDQGNNIYLVEASKGEIPNLLPAEEVQTIDKLLTTVPGSLMHVISPISPDDQTVLGDFARGISFINIRDGSTVRLKPVEGLSALSNYFWIDNDTLGFYANDQHSQVVLVASDRHSGASKVVRKFDTSAGYPFFASQDGRRVLLATLPDSSGGSSGAALALTLPYAGGSDQLKVHSTPAEALRAFAAGLDQVPKLSESPLTEPTTLSVRDTVTGETRQIGAFDAGLVINEAAFSQDGSKFAIAVERVPVSRPGGHGDGALFSDEWYRDATGNLPPEQNPFLQSNQLTTLDFGSGEVKNLYARDGDGTVYHGVSWSTDNQTLVVTKQLPGRPAGRRYPIYNPQYRSGASIRLLDSRLQEFRRLDKIELSDVKAQVTFVSPDELIIQSHYELDRRPYYYNWRSGELRSLADRPGMYNTVVSTHGSRGLVFVYTSFTEPPDFYRLNWDGTAFSRLTWTQEPGREIGRAKQYPVSFTLRNRETFRGVLLLPSDAPFPPKKLPIVVWQEGGPTQYMRNEWTNIVESPFGLLPHFGFGVLVVPLYGRYGTGPARFDGLVAGKNFGQIDIDAQAEIADQLRARGWASKVGIEGCSYGGYFTSQSVTRHPTTYDAAHTNCSLVDVFTEWSRGYPALAPWMEGLPPASALAEYQKDSPAYNASRVRTPLLAFHGTNDFLPATVMENYMLQIINNGVPSKLIKYQGSGHGINTPLTTALQYETYGQQEQLVWFRKYLMGK